MVTSLKFRKHFDQVLAKFKSFPRGKIKCRLDLRQHDTIENTKLTLQFFNVLCTLYFIFKTSKKNFFKTMPFFKKKQNNKHVEEKKKLITK